MSTYPDDTILFQAFQQGRPDAAETVFYRYFERCCIYAEGITRDTVGTEDIVVDCFQKSWDRRTTFPGLDDFRRYLYRIVYNAAIDRTRTKRQHAGAHAQIRYLQEQRGEEEDVREREILRAELLQELYQEIEGLPDRCREIFKLIFIQGLSTDQIAAQLDINVQTVRSQKSRAIELLRTRLLRKNRILIVFFFSLLEKL